MKFYDLKHILSLDFRALAAFRISLGILLVCDQLVRFEDLWAHYTDFGVMPRAFLMDYHWNDMAFSLHMASGQAWWAALLFALGILAGVAIALGYRTRVAMVLGWVLFVSTLNRNPMVEVGADVLLRQLLFWGMFLPLGACWSLDSNQPAKHLPQKRYFGGPSIALILQVSFVYWATYFLKSGSEWRVDGTASYFALSLEQFTTWFGQWLLNFPELLKWSTFGVLYLEGIGPCLFFVPMFFPFFRTVAVLALIAMHLSFDLTMHLGLFPWVDAAALLVLLPSAFWDFLERKQPWSFWTPSLRRCKIVFSVGLAAILRLIPPPGRPPAFQTHPLVHAASIGLIVYVAWWNVGTIAPSVTHVPKGLTGVAHVLRLDQKWNLFAPYPTKSDGWYVISGNLADGTPIDVYRSEIGPVGFEKPAHVANMYPNNRWRKYMMAIWLKRNKDHRLYLSRYYCKNWNVDASKKRSDKLASFQIHFMLEKSVLPPNVPTVKKHTLWKHNCFK